MRNVGDLRVICFKCTLSNETGSLAHYYYYLMFDWEWKIDRNYFYSSKFSQHSSCLSLWCKKNRKNKLNQSFSGNICQTTVKEHGTRKKIEKFSTSNHICLDFCWTLKFYQLFFFYTYAVFATDMLIILNSYFFSS